MALEAGEPGGKGDYGDHAGHRRLQVDKRRLWPPDRGRCFGPADQELAEVLRAKGYHRQKRRGRIRRGSSWQDERQPASHQGPVC